MMELNRRRVIGGGSTIVWNQLISNGNYSLSSNESKSQDQYWLSYLYFTPITLQTGHVYALIRHCNATSKNDEPANILPAHCLRNTANNGTLLFNAMAPTPNQLATYKSDPKNSSAVMLRFFNKEKTSVNGLKANGFVCINDLTLMFGEGNEPATISDYTRWYEANIGPLDVYQPYNAGEIRRVKYLP